MRIIKPKIVFFISILLCLAGVTVVSARVFYFDPTAESRGTFRDEGNLSVTDANLLRFNVNATVTPIFYLNSKGNITQMFGTATTDETWRIFSQTEANPSVQTLRFEVKNTGELRFGKDAANMLSISSGDTGSAYIDFSIGSVGSAVNNNGLKIYNSDGKYATIGVKGTSFFFGNGSTEKGLFVNGTGDVSIQGGDTAKGVFNSDSVSVAIGSAPLANIFESEIHPEVTFTACEAKGGVVSNGKCLLRVLGLSNTAGSATLNSSLALNKVTLLDTGVGNFDNMYLAASQAWINSQNYVNPNDSGKSPLKYNVTGTTDFFNLSWKDYSLDVPNIEVSGRPTTYSSSTAHTHPMGTYLVHCKNDGSGTNCPHYVTTVGGTNQVVLSCKFDTNATTQLHNGDVIVYGKKDPGDTGCQNFGNAGCTALWAGNTTDDSWAIANYGDRYSGFIICSGGGAYPP